MLVYEVNLAVDRSIGSEYRNWLPEHVDEMLGFAGFLGADIWERDPRVEGETNLERLLFTVHYRVRDRASLDAYLRDHAATMRALGVSRFGDRFTATRRVLMTATREDRR